jgi:hypothetical protein
MTWINESHRSTYNSQFKKKKQTVLNNLMAGDGIKVEHTEAGTVVFDQGMAVLPNDGRADEIHKELESRQTHPGHYAVTKHREGMSRQDVDLHPMRALTISLPWNKYDELGRKIEDD